MSESGNRLAKTCSRCGEKNLRWVKSGRTGRFYLAQTTGGPDVCGEPIPFMPHKCPPVGERHQVMLSDGWQTAVFTGTGWEIETSTEAQR